MNATNNTWVKTLPAVLTLGLATGEGPMNAQEAAKRGETIYEMNPFIIDASQDSGYTATHTLAGTRIKTDVKNLGAAISIYTSEFLEDINSHDASTLLTYTLNTEVGGLDGNFSGTDESGQRYDANEERAEPQNNQRVRGLGKATLTRGYFLTDIGFDTYNTDRVTINRGANSLLFGIGEPGGVINNSLKRARLNSEITDVELEYGSYGSSRGTIDLNRVLVKDRVALRVAGLHEDKRYRQEEAFTRNKRVYGNLEAILFANENVDWLDATRLRLNGEAVSVGGAPPDLVPPSISYLNWFTPRMISTADFTGIERSLIPLNELSPAEGGTWEFQATSNHWAGRPLHTPAASVKNRRVSIIYNDPNATEPTLGIPAGTPGDDLQGTLGLVNWNTAGNRDTIGSIGLTGTPGIVAAGLGPDDRTRGNGWSWTQTNSAFANADGVGYTVPTLRNRDVFDYKNHLLSGGGDSSTQRFEAANISLEQTFFNNAFGFELAYDKQAYGLDRDFFWSAGAVSGGKASYDVSIDVTEYLLNGQPNPNLGRPLLSIQNSQIVDIDRERETFRATAFGRYNFKRHRNGFMRHLGNHSFTGLRNSTTIDNRRFLWRDVWDSNEDRAFIWTGTDDLLSSFNRAGVSAYIGPSVLGAQSADDVRLQQINIPRPVLGKPYTISWASQLASTRGRPELRGIENGDVWITRELEGYLLQRQKIDSTAVSWMAEWFDGDVVGLFGWREDTTRSWENNNGGSARLPDGTIDRTLVVLGGPPALDVTDQSITWSVVARFPEQRWFQLPAGMDFQVHYGESENFNPVGLRNDTLGNPIPQPTGTTREYGFTLGFNDNKYLIKMNWFDSQLKDQTQGTLADAKSYFEDHLDNYKNAELNGIPFLPNAHLFLTEAESAAHPVQTYQQYYDALLTAMPNDLKAVHNPRLRDTNGDGIGDDWEFDDISNPTGTQDRAAKGVELEFVANPTENWRIAASVGEQETTQSNTAPVNYDLAVRVSQGLEASRTLDLLQDQADTQIRAQQRGSWYRNRFSRVQGVRGFDGTLSPEQRKYRASLVTRYKFGEGMFKGFSLGGSARWQSSAAIGYRYDVFDIELPSGGTIEDVRTPILSDPYRDKGAFNGDLFGAYSRMIFANKVKWTARLYVRNAIGSDDDMVVKMNPDGEVAVIRVAPSPTWSLSSSFEF